MRWGLRNQILIPVALLTFFIIFGLGIWLAWNYANNSQRQIELRLTGLATTLRDANFPINQRILEQLKGLSGADFVALDSRTAISTDNQLAKRIQPFVPRNAHIDPTGIKNVNGFESSVIRIQGDDYFWFTIERDPRRGDQFGSIEVLYPMQEISRQRWQALMPILTSCLVAWLLAVLVSSLLASKLAKPIGLLRQQLGSIAQGDFSAFPVPQQPDEMRDLARGVNEMADQLRLSQQTIRESERLKTLSMLSSGIAHQLRNSATGALLALDVAEQACQCKQGTESLSVASRQLQLLEKYIQKLLKLDQRNLSPRQLIDVRTLVHDVETLVRPFAKHHNANLEINLESNSACEIWGEVESLQELLLNLLLNAIQAAAATAVHSMERNAESKNSEVFGYPKVDMARLPSVSLNVYRTEKTQVFEVRDTGSGVSPEIEQRIFQPFVTGRLNGIGLGLYIARQIAETHQGTIGYHRENQETCFSVHLPLQTAAGSSRGPITT